jgi:hypothetical protein
VFESLSGIAPLGDELASETMVLVGILAKATTHIIRRLPNPVKSSASHPGTSLFVMDVFIIMSSSCICNSNYYYVIN